MQLKDEAFFFAYYPNGGEKIQKSYLIMVLERFNNFSPAWNMFNVFQSTLARELRAIN